MASGSLDIPQLVPTEVQKNPHAKRLLDAVVNRQRLQAASYSYLQQSVRTNNAAPVADLGTKPTSVFTVAMVEDRARVIAHLSEAMPIRYLRDYSNLESWLKSEMAQGC